MDVTASSPALVRTQAARVLVHPAVWVLGPLVAVSSIVRLVIAWRHSTARYFPDEYIYTALSRSIAHGHLTIRGETAHFPGLLEPLVAAPLWGFFSTETAYRLVQGENAVAASLAAIPIYILARDLKLSRSYAYLCCVYALVIPMLVMIPFAISDFIGYPLALGTIAAAVKAIDRPSAKRQLVFLAFATLATLARVEYFVLVPAYLIAAIVIERRNFLRTQRTALFALLPVAAGVLVAATGYYSTAPSRRIPPGGLDLDSLAGLPAVARRGSVHGPRSGRRPHPARSRDACGVRLRHQPDGDPPARTDKRGRGRCRVLQGALPLRPPAAHSARIRDLPGARQAPSARDALGWPRRSSSPRPGFPSRRTRAESGTSIRSR